MVVVVGISTLVSCVGQTRANLALEVWWGQVCLVLTCPAQVGTLAPGLCQGRCCPGPLGICSRIQVAYRAVDFFNPIGRVT